MKKQIIKMSMLAMMVMGGVNAAHAATSSSVTVSGTVNAVTCQLNLDKATLDLGTAVPSDFAAANSIIKKQKVTASLTNCGTGTVGSDAGIQVAGNTIPAGTNNNIFGSDSTATWGFGITKEGDAATALLKNGDKLQSFTQGAVGTTLQTSSYAAEIGFVAPSIAAGAITASPQQSTPITFLFVNP